MNTSFPPNVRLRYRRSGCSELRTGVYGNEPVERGRLCDFDFHAFYYENESGSVCRFSKWNTTVGRGYQSAGRNGKNSLRHDRQQYRSEDIRGQVHVRQ